MLPAIRHSHLGRFSGAAFRIEQPRFKPTRWQPHRKDCYKKKRTPQQRRIKPGFVAFGESRRSGKKDSRDLNSWNVSRTLGGPANAAGMNKFGAVMIGGRSGAALETLPRPAGIDCLVWRISGCRDCVVRQ
jgi:hypothetical protein